MEQRRGLQPANEFYDEIKFQDVEDDRFAIRVVLAFASVLHDRIRKRFMCGNKIRATKTIG